MLAAGHPLSTVTETLVPLQPGIRLLPATDDRLETTWWSTARPTRASARTTRHRPRAPGSGRSTSRSGGSRLRAQLPAGEFRLRRRDAAKRAAGVPDALAEADVVLVAPSNPVVSIAPILAIGPLRDALVAGSAPVIGVSPIISGSPVRGMADKCLAALDVPMSAAGWAGSTARSSGGILDGWLVDRADAAHGARVSVTVHMVTDEPATLAMVERALELPDAAMNRRGDGGLEIAGYRHRRGTPGDDLAALIVTAHLAGRRGSWW